MVDHEDPPASTAMFRAFVQRGEADNSSDRRTVGAAVWIVAAVVVIAVVAVLVAVLA